MLAGATVVASILMAAAAQAATVDVSDVVSGSAGAWLHDFTVANNLPDDGDLYFFGVSMDARDIAASPAGFDPNAWPAWNNSGFGGSNVNYNNNWIDFSFTYLPSGSSLGGFQVLDTNTVAQTDIKWFAFGFMPNNGSYNGADCFHCGFNPGFEGVAGAGGAPEPAAWALMIGGFGLAGASLRRRRAIAA
jgi:hypothetical protein